MNKVEVVIELIGQMRIICFDYFKNMTKRIITGNRITHVVPYMAVVK